MTDKTFILILKANYKKYFENGESVGLEIQKLVAQFRQEIEDDALRQKYKIEEKISFKTTLKPKKWQH
jgi:hypothetical protein